MSKPVVILGAGGHAGVITDLLEKAGYTIEGYLVDDLESCKKAGNIPDYPLFGSKEDIATKLGPDKVVLVNGIGSVGKNVEIRKGLFEEYSAKGYKFITVVHPSAVIAKNVELGKGTVVMAGAIIQNGAKIGDNVIINTGAIVDHDCHIGDHVHLATGATLSGTVTVGAESHIGTGANIIHGITIGEKIIIGAGATVVSTISEAATYTGTPAKKRS